MAEPKKSAPSGPKPATGPKPTASLRTEHASIITRLNGLAERLETLHESATLDQLALAREVLDFVAKNVAPHARAEEYTLYPAADWAAGEGSHLTETTRFEHQLVAKRCQALEKEISAGAAAGRLMPHCYDILSLIVAHFQVTEQVILPYLDKAFDEARFEKEVLTPLRVERNVKR